MYFIFYYLSSICQTWWIAGPLSLSLHMKLMPQINGHFVASAAMTGSSSNQNLVNSFFNVVLKIIYLLPVSLLCTQHWHLCVVFSFVCSILCNLKSGCSIITQPFRFLVFKAFEWNSASIMQTQYHICLIASCTNAASFWT